MALRQARHALLTLGPPLLAPHAVAVSIAHVPVRGMASGHRGNAVAPRFGTGDTPVAVVIPERNGVAVSGAPRAYRRRPRGRLTGRAGRDLHRRRIAH